jgi:glycosyltransferase involved in cell wall biosynthesis
LPYQVVPNFVPDDLGLHQENTEAYLAQLPPEEFLLFVGDLGHEKGIFVLLRAYAELSNAPPLVLIGRAYGDTPTVFPPHVFMYKSWPHAAVLQAWRRSMVALVPSVWPEPFGLVVIEAMMSGRPVIASKIGGVTDIVVDGKTGLLVPPDDSTALRQAIERLLAYPALRTRMGQAARQKVMEFQASAVLPRLEQIYADLLSDCVSWTAKVSA